jgi:hypothetical protein
MTAYSLDAPDPRCCAGWLLWGSRTHSQTERRTAPLVKGFGCRPVVTYPRAPRPASDTMRRHWRTRRLGGIAAWFSPDLSIKGGKSLTPLRVGDHDPGIRARTRLPAGGRRIRTAGPTSESAQPRHRPDVANSQHPSWISNPSYQFNQHLCRKWNQRFESAFEPVREYSDSPLEGSGFEPLVPRPCKPIRSQPCVITLWVILRRQKPDSGCISRARTAWRVCRTLRVAVLGAHHASPTIKLGNDKFTRTALR